MGGINVWLNPDLPHWNVETLGEGEVDYTVLGSWDRPYLWIDAREPEPFDQDHIPSVINLSLSHFDEQAGLFLNKWELGLAVVVYCNNRQCRASKELAERLPNEFAMDEIYVLKGEWGAWLEVK
ncbi:hypothetical protein GCM10007047_24450 [Cerasicoccus arenae]|uniref:Rhodanese domain-containing protein n=1 Tax=Cerasicoccus arenae TaxID=424488 RepID=A0A8J3DCR5_9BACT|nr:hypothetical protein GCM10007047_24450 [Cerasicoccus arenae]